MHAHIFVCISAGFHGWTHCFDMFLHSSTHHACLSITELEKACYMDLHRTKDCVGIVLHGRASAHLTPMHASSASLPVRLSAKCSRLYSMQHVHDATKQMHAAGQ